MSLDCRPFNILMIEDFKMDLIMVAAFLTIIGYSLNDTIVVFDVFVKCVARVHA